MTGCFADEIGTDGGGVDVEMAMVDDLSPCNCACKAVIEGGSAQCVVGHVVGDYAIESAMMDGRLYSRIGIRLRKTSTATRVKRKGRLLCLLFVWHFGLVRISLFRRCW